MCTREGQGCVGEGRRCEVRREDCSVDECAGPGCEGCSRFVAKTIADEFPGAKSILDKCKAERERDAAIAECERLRARVAGLEGALLTPQECADLVCTLADYLELNGLQHDDPDCPEDDTCDCPTARRLSSMLTTERVFLARALLTRTDPAPVERYAPSPPDDDMREHEAQALADAGWPEPATGKGER